MIYPETWTAQRHMYTNNEYLQGRGRYPRIGRCRVASADRRLWFYRTDTPKRFHFMTIVEEKRVHVAEYRSLNEAQTAAARWFLDNPQGVTAAFLARCPDAKGLLVTMLEDADRVTVAVMEDKLAEEGIDRSAIRNQLEDLGIWPYFNPPGGKMSFAR